MIHSFLKKKLALSWRAPQENDAKFRFPIHVQGIRQFHDNCKIAKCQIVATLAPVYGIPGKLLQSLANELTPVLRFIFEQSLLNGDLPVDLTRANVAPIFKKGSKLQAVNYRPVSLTCIPYLYHMQTF